MIKKMKGDLLHPFIMLISKKELNDILEGLKEVLKEGITTNELYPPEKFLKHSSIVAEEYIRFFEEKNRSHDPGKPISLGLPSKN